MQTPGAHARYLVLRNCRQDLAAAAGPVLGPLWRLARGLAAASAAAVTRASLGRFGRRPAD